VHKKNYNEHFHGLPECETNNCLGPQSGEMPVGWGGGRPFALRHHNVCVAWNQQLTGTAK
jgi:hypothetical protein